MSFDFAEYTRIIQREYNARHADSFTCRQALKSLIEGADSSLYVDHDLRRAEVDGPDVVVYRGGLPAGFVLTTSIGGDLNSLNARATRLRAVLPNVLLTNYLEMREGSQSVRLGSLRSGQIEFERSPNSVFNLLRGFAARTLPPVRSSTELAQRTAHLAAILRDLVSACLGGDTPDRTLVAQYETWRAAFSPGLTAAQFADEYAQAVTFGLVAARMRHTGAGRQQVFTPRDAIWDQPATSPLMRALFREIDQLDSRVTWLIHSMVALLAAADIDTIRGEFGRRSRQDDPLNQLYETFHSAYNPQEPIASLPEALAIYLVGGVHHLLHRRFKRALGLADEDVRVINPAVGRGTLLFFIIQQMYDTLRQQHQLGAWDSYVSEELLPRLYGFEISLAAYALAHLKVSLQLNTTGYRFASNQRLNVFLRTQTSVPDAANESFAGALKAELRMNSALLPDLPVTVLIGQSENPGEATALARQVIRQDDGGIAALILPPALLDAVEFQALRTELLAFYSDLYLLRLPDAVVSIFVRRPGWQGSTARRVHYAVCEGSPQANLTWLAEHTLTSTNWREIHPQGPHYYLTTVTNRVTEDPLSWPLDEVMPLHVGGLDETELALAADGHNIPLLYRPFDIRYTHVRPTLSVLRQMLRGDNLALSVCGVQVLCTQHLIHAHMLGDPTHLFPLYVYPDTAQLVIDSPFAPGTGGRRPNLNAQFILRLAAELDMTFLPDGRGDLKDTFGPEDVFHYLYATLNSPAYRQRDPAVAVGKWPRVLLPDSGKQFRTLAHAGRDLARLHLLRRADNWPLVSGFNGPGANRVEAGYPRFVELAGEPGGRIYINKEKYFNGVERPVWNMQVGGVQVLRDWLAERSGQLLSWRDLHYYQQIIAALTRSQEALQDIDETLD